MWQNKYNEIVKQIIEIEKRSNIEFDKKRANELIENMTLYGSTYLEKKEIQFLNCNPELDNKYGEQLLQIEKIYNQKKSITELEVAIKKYIEIWKEIIEKAKG